MSPPRIVSIKFLVNDAIVLVGIDELLVVDVDDDNDENNNDGKSPSLVAEGSLIVIQ